MSGVAVVSSLYGGYDEPRPAPSRDVEAGTEFVMVTDDPRPVPGWRVVHEPRPDVHPRLAAKVAKCAPYRYCRGNPDVVIWMDASARILRPDTVAFLVSESTGWVSQFAHPLRDCIYDEAPACAGMPKYEGRPFLEQVRHYMEAGYPAHWGLWATGVIVYRRGVSPNGAALLNQFGDRWLAEQVRWTYQDQLSEVPVLIEMGMRPHTIPGDLYENGYVSFAGHRDLL